MDISRLRGRMISPGIFEAVHIRWARAPGRDWYALQLVDHLYALVPAGPGRQVQSYGENWLPSASQARASEKWSGVLNIKGSHICPASIHIKDFGHFLPGSPTPSPRNHS